jgi:hypothetical protein
MSLVKVLLHGAEDDYGTKTELKSICNEKYDLKDHGTNFIFSELELTKFKNGANFHKLMPYGTMNDVIENSMGLKDVFRANNLSFATNVHVIDCKFKKAFPSAEKSSFNFGCDTQNMMRDSNRSVKCLEEQGLMIVELELSEPGDTILYVHDARRIKRKLSVLIEKFRKEGKNMTVDLMIPKITLETKNSSLRDVFSKTRIDRVIGRSNSSFYTVKSDDRGFENPWFDDITQTTKLSISENGTEKANKICGDTLGRKKYYFIAEHTIIIMHEKLPIVVASVISGKRGIILESASKNDDEKIDE